MDIRRDMDPVEKLKGTKRVPKRGLGGSGGLPGSQTMIFWRPQNSTLDGNSSLLYVPKMGAVLKAFRKGASGAKMWIPYRRGLKNQRSTKSQKDVQKGRFSEPLGHQKSYF